MAVRLGLEEAAKVLRTPLVAEREANNRSTSTELGRSPSGQLLHQGQGGDPQEPQVLRSPTVSWMVSSPTLDESKHHTPGCLY